MVKYKVVISRDARASLREIHTYLKEDVSKKATEHVRKGILAVLFMLKGIQTY